MKRAAWLSLLVLAGGSTVLAGQWKTDYQKAVEEARADGKYLLLYFTESDGGPMSDILEKEVLAHPIFTTFAAENLVCVTVDIPRKKLLSVKLKAQNKGLQQKYDVSGFPSVILLAPGGDEVGRVSYRKGGPKPYVEYLKSLIKAHEWLNPAAAEAVRTARANPAAMDSPSGAESAFDTGTASESGSISIGVAARKEYELRTWTSTSGKTVEARFVSEFNGTVVLLTADGKQVRIAAGQLAGEDLDYLKEIGATP